MGTNSLLALRANMVIEADIQDVGAGARGSNRQLIIDLETSNLNPIDGDIIRFRAVNRFDPDDCFDEWVKPPRPMLPFAEKFIGTTYAKLAHCRSIDAALSDFLDFIDGAELLADNLEFDLMFLNAAIAATCPKNVAYFRIPKSRT